ncbi:SRPBCC family protein [Chloroflexota bacterium]
MRLLRNIWEGICGTSLMFVLIILPCLRSKLRKWGSTDEELSRELPGDDLIDNINYRITHAITIKAAPTDVWPWIVQLGQGRGGFYTYELLENIAGCKIRNADTIIPEFQDIAVGDKVMMHPTMAPLIVIAIDPGKSLTTRLRYNIENYETIDTSEPLPPKYHDGTWLFYIEETPEGGTRLITRVTHVWNQSKMNTFLFGLMGISELVMSRKMLKGIRKRAEKASSII